jgi:putative MATE family efflux protein
MDKVRLNLWGLFLFSLPSILSSLAEPLAGQVDTAMVGRLSTSWLAALAINTVVFNSFTWIFNFLIHVSTQSIAEHEANRDPQILNGRIRVSFGICFFLSIASTFVLLGGGQFWIELAGATEGNRSVILSYFIPRAMGQGTVLFFLTSLSIVRGLGLVTTAFYLVLFNTLTNIVLNYLFLYQWNWGLEGAAYGTVISFSLSFLVTLFILFKRREIRLYFFRAKTPWDLWSNFGRKSFHLFIRSASLTGSLFLATRLASQMGLVSLATYQVLLQIWLFASFLVDGLAISGNVLGASFYSKGDLEKTRSAFLNLLILGVLIGILFNLLYGLIPEKIIGLYTTDPEVLSLGLTLIAWVSFSQVVNSVAFVFDGLLFGLSGFSYLKTHMLIGVLICFLPLALVSIWHQHLAWIWAGLVALNVYRLVSNGIYLIKRDLLWQKKAI